MDGPLTHGWPDKKQARANNDIDLKNVRRTQLEISGDFWFDSDSKSSFLFPDKKSSSKNTRSA